MAERLDGPTLTSAGYLRADARLTRVGVLTYYTADGQVSRELRSPDEVFDPASIDSLRMVPVTDGHPMGGVNPESARMVSRGTVGETVRTDDIYLSAPIMITDAALINKIRDGQAREVSCGYTCDVDPTPGEFNGETYDAIQRNIRYNHVAVVPRGRAGAEVAIRMDGQDITAAVACAYVPEIKEENKMAKIEIAGVTYECSDELAAAISAQASAIKADELAQATARADALSAEIDQLKAQVAQLPELARARAALEREAAKYTGDLRLDGLSDGEIKHATVKAILPELSLADDAAESYVQGAYVAALQIAASRDTAAKVGAVREVVKADAAPVKSAHQQMIERQAQAWKQGK